MRDGSPPRSWGKRRRFASRAGRRFTPTLVGKTADRRSNAAVRFTPTLVGNTCRATTLHGFTVHPHARGEDRTICMPSVTPSVHPHARGENDVGLCAHDRPDGSPPRSWGQLLQAATARPTRFTPTLVGKTCARTCDARLHGSPPRSWGRHQLRRSARPRGSPPRSWGRHAQSACRATTQRFTPTLVGKTNVGAARPRRRFTPTLVGNTAHADWRIAPPVHPHARGENASLVAGQVSDSGSPPRSWGIPRGVAAQPSQGGSPPRSWGKPTYARSIVGVCGSPPRSWGKQDGRSSRWWPTVHPHARGEDCDSLDPVASRRFTPTLVGNTSPCAS